jgi:hypothetical protein
VLNVKTISAAVIGAAAIGLSVGSVQSAQAASIVTNGGFEQPQIPSGSYQQPSSIPGWTIEAGAPVLEIQNNDAGSPFEGNQFIELDSTGVTKFYQDLITKVGQQYLLTFAFSPRPRVSDNQLDVEWNGSLVASFSASSIGLPNTSWITYSSLLTATNNVTRLSFGNLNEVSDGVGSYLDAVSVTSVPAPVPTPALLPGLIGMGVAALRKRKNDRSEVAEVAEV